MVSNFYLLFMIASFLLVTNAREPISVDDFNLLARDLNTNNEDERIAFVSPSIRSYETNGQPPSDRQSFGRKHHWDTYFGRRR
ncbi:unnamed protein product [Rotaria socialis]|uniref:Uncharacterized protein n=1 Tax=Rotaria socialis TaxID=392032 RepID=A0A818BG87_9BILA|nr:unnamed protein product [Rotaria socialis]CAF3411311.1 unnamed protein product [Rotaria socialis]CAF3571661.1 unnamed protein product [Rotaria socialis]